MEYLGTEGGEENQEEKSDNATEHKTHKRKKNITPRRISENKTSPLLW